jgi:hypothetical protein
MYNEKDNTQNQLKNKKDMKRYHYQKLHPIPLDLTTQLAVEWKH